MIGLKFGIKNLNSVTMALRDLNTRVVNAADLVVKEAGERVAKDAKAGAPSASPSIRGYKRKIRSVYDKRLNMARIASWHRGKPNPLGHLLEFGHRARNGRFVDGKPHLLPAFDRHKGRIVDRLRKEIGA